MSAVLLCVHYWTEWSTYFDEKNPDKPGRWRKCMRCNALQRNDDPEPRVMLARIEQESPANK